MMLCQHFVSRGLFSFQRRSVSGSALVLSAGLLWSSMSAAQLSCPQDFTAASFSFTGSIQSFTLPATTDTLIARVSGAGGGSSVGGNGGRGAMLEGSFSVQGGTSLQILVGSTGSFGTGNDGEAGGGGGGGASLLALGDDLASSQPLIIAAGGGGAGRGLGADGGDGGIPDQAGGAVRLAGGAGGDGGGIGGAGDLIPNVDGEPGAPGGVLEFGGFGTSCGSGGAGLLGDGSNENGLITDAISLLAGGDGASNSFVFSNGGFGGGGAPENCGGGGGGFSGGGAGGAGDSPPDSNGGGGGGGSLNISSAAQNLGALVPPDTDGLVEICYNAPVIPPPTGNTPPVAVPVFGPFALMLLSMGMLAFGLWASRRQRSHA